MTAIGQKRSQYYTAEQIASNKERVALFREKRLARGWSQKRLAEEAGIDESGLRRIELGQTRPTWETRQKLCRALGLPEERHFSTEERNTIFMSLQEEIQWTVRKNMRVIKSIAGDPEDVCQELYIEALRAIDRYVPSGTATVKTFVMRNVDRYINRIIVRQYRHGLTGKVSYPLAQISVVSLENLTEAGMQFVG